MLSIHLSESMIRLQQGHCADWRRKRNDDATDFYFQYLSNAAVTNLLGTNPVRFFMFGLAPDDVQYPYAVWQVVSGSPENYLNNRPQIENHVIQIDVYSNSAPLLAIYCQR